MKYCKVCNKQLEKRQKSYCSNDCKFSDPEYNKNKDRKIINDPKKAIKHRNTGKIYKDENNISGILSKYSREVLGYPLNMSEWDVIDIIPDNIIKCGLCDWTTKDVNNRSGMFTSHLKKHHPNIDIEEYTTMFSQHKHLFNKQLLKINIEKEQDKVGIICLECGKKMKKITQTHLKKHNMTPEEYRIKHGVINLSSTHTRKKLSQNYYNLNILSGPDFKSKKELDVVEFLRENKIKTISGYRKLGTEVDIYLPDYNVAIEFNGLYWHSEKSSGKKYNYHIDKTRVCEAKGVKLIHLFEDTWEYKSDIVKSRLLNEFKKTKKRIYARKCEVKEIDSRSKNNFLENNHLQGKDVSKVKLGLFFEGSLVSVMTFSGFRKSMGRDKKKGCYELSRFCSILNTNVIGGAGKLLSYFESNYGPKVLITYADRSWTSKLNISNLYINLGFVHKGETRPSYWYMYRYKNRIHRYVYAKHKILSKFDTADPNLTEWENMKKLGFDRIWDCGNLKYEKLYYE